MQTVNKMTIVGAQIVDGSGGAPIPEGVLTVVDGSIASIAREAEVPREGTVIDASGCTLLPGLIDSHVHVMTIAQKRGDSETDAALWGAYYLPSALAGGITTVRDLGTNYAAIHALKRGAENDRFLSPRLLVAGRAVAMTGGHHYDSLAIEADGPYEVAKAVRQQIKDGADAIKFMASGGAGTAGQSPHSAQLTVEELRAGVDVAHDAGRLTAAHAHSVLGIKNAIRAGVDSIEHGVFFDDEAIDLMLENDVALVPTLSVYQRIVDAENTPLASAPFMTRTSQAIVGPHAESFRRCLQAGVRIALGTDSGSAYHPLQTGAAFEVELWVRNGMAPLAAITSATRIPAEICGLGDEVGVLAVGKRADLLLVEGDALADITALQRPRHVFKDGKLVFSNDTTAS